MLYFDCNEERRNVKRFLFFILALSFLFADASEAQAARRRRALKPNKPKVVLNINMGDVKYLYRRREDLECENDNVGGCAHIEMYYSPQLMQTGSDTVFQVEIGFKDFVVEVSSDYPKGSCKFNLVLKHELTHVAFARAALERYAHEMGAALLAEAERMRTPFSNHDFNRLVRVGYKHFVEINKIQEEQHNLMDSKGNNAYQWEQCLGKD